MSTLPHECGVVPLLIPALKTKNYILTTKRRPTHRSVACNLTTKYVSIATTVFAVTEGVFQPSHPSTVVWSLLNVVMSKYSAYRKKGSEEMSYMFTCRMGWLRGSASGWRRAGWTRTSFEFVCSHMNVAGFFFLILHTHHHHRTSKDRKGKKGNPSRLETQRLSRTPFQKEDTMGESEDLERSVS